MYRINKLFPMYCSVHELLMLLKFITMQKTQVQRKNTLNEVPLSARTTKNIFGCPKVKKNQSLNKDAIILSLIHEVYFKENLMNLRNKDTKKAKKF